MGKHAVVLFVCLCGAVTLAAGDNTHGQGVRFAGRGFDEQEPLKDSQPVPWFDNSKNAWPPSGRYDSIGGAKLRVDVQCEQSPQDPDPDPLFALCYGKVSVVADNGSVRGVTACEFKDASQGTVPLLAIRGNWNTTSGAFERGNQVLTFACAPTFDEKFRWLYKIPPITGDLTDPLSDLDTSENLGVLAKCYFWGFGHRKPGEQGDEGRFRTYQACLRAARAEYCGGGISQTLERTIIQVYEPEETRVGQPTVVNLEARWCERPKDPTTKKDPKERPPLKFKPCFEALWDEQRAVCVSHARFVEMPARDCQKGFPHTFTMSKQEARIIPVTSPADPVFLHCQINDYQSAVDRARVKNRSGINKLDRKVRSCQNNIPCP